MANRKQLKLVRSGVQEWNEWRSVNLKAAIDLRDCDLSSAFLGGAYLRWANLGGTNLSRAMMRQINLRQADLHGANLSHADLNGADLRGTDLSDADLSDADLSEADLRGSDLSRAKLRRANLRGTYLRETNLGETDIHEAYLLETILSNVDLRGVLGLDSCQHYGPSILDHRTLVGFGAIPSTFLRGCGLPDSLIGSLASLGSDRIHFYSCFISYSTKDQQFANRLHADLQNKGVRCWFAPHDIQSGKKIHEQIDQAIRVYDKLLLILSPASMKSEWVNTEIAKARKREIREKQQMLYPLRLVDFETLRDWECFDADSGKDSAREIREYFIPDFSAWKSDHDAYKIAFDRLLKDLQQEKNPDPDEQRG